MGDSRCTGTRGAYKCEHVHRTLVFLQHNPFYIHHCLSMILLNIMFFILLYQLEEILLYRVSANSWQEEGSVFPSSPIWPRNSHLLNPTQLDIPKKQRSRQSLSLDHRGQGVEVC